MKILVVGDVHFQETFTSRLDNVWDTFVDKFTQIYDIAKTNGVGAIVFTGDLFNNKNPRATSHRFLNKVVWLLKKSPAPLYSIVGNHDIQFNDNNTLRNQPLGTLFFTGVVNRLQFDTWDKFSVQGIDYIHGITQLNDKHNLVITHAFIQQSPGSMFGGERVYGYDEVTSLLNADFVVNGHDHAHYPIVTHGKTTIVRPGALLRFSRNETDIERPVAVAVIDLVTKTAHYEYLKTQPPKEVFNLTEKDLKEESNKEVVSFVESLQNISTQKNKSLHEEVEEMGLAADVKEQILSYIENDHV